MDKLTIEALKDAGLTFEEIQSVIEGEKNIEEGKILTEEEMNYFIKNELFSKYMINA